MPQPAKRKLEELDFQLPLFGAALARWHASQGDPIYAVGSYAIAGKLQPKRATVEAALAGLERIERSDAHTLNVIDHENLLDLIEQTTQLLECYPEPSSDAELN